MFFYGKLRKIIPKVSLLPFLIWSSQNCVTDQQNLVSMVTIYNNEQEDNLWLLTIVSLNIRQDFSANYK